MSNYFDHLFSIFDAPQIDTLSQLPRNIVLITSVRTYGGYGFGDRNADGSRILEFADGLNLVICNTLFMKQECKLVTYVAGSAKSTVDYIMLRQGDKVKVRNVEVIPNEECIPKHKLLVMDMPFNTT